MNEQFNEGKIVESEFKQLMTKFGYTINANEIQDCKEHWDIICNINGKLCRVDVKGMKKRNRSDINKDPSIHWVETRNASNRYSNGEKDRLGWLYGKADYFAFQTDINFIIVKKEDLISLIDEKCLDKIRYVKTDFPEFYKRYTRNGRDDEMIMIKTNDLMCISPIVVNRLNPDNGNINEIMCRLLKKKKESNK